MGAASNGDFSVAEASRLGAEDGEGVDWAKFAPFTNK